MDAPARFDMVVIGAGPAGQKAAIQAAKEHYRVLVVDRGGSVGGECVHRGTIPSKTLRETAVYLSGLKLRSEGVLQGEIRPDLKIESLMRREQAVCRAHEQFLSRQLERNGVELWRGRARFASPTGLVVTGVHGGQRRVEAGVIVIATGSRPRTPQHVPVDHEHVLDSDSILSLIYLPTSLTVLGAGVIACEYASIFAALGVKVTIIDKGERPLAFLDSELTDRFVADFVELGGRFLARRKVERVMLDGVSGVTTLLDGGDVVTSEKLLCALGRVAQIDGLGVKAAGLNVTPQGYLEVDEHYRAAAPHIYAVGDVIGPPSLAAASMEQGRRAARHALGLPLDDRADVTPVGVYTIPELACVGLTEERVRELRGEALVGRARFSELARGQITGAVRGMLKLVADPDDGRLLGAHIVGDGAAELVHVAQIAMLESLTSDVFIDNVFNFPTMAEAYRVAALDLQRNRGDTLRRVA